jgi:hypothetical protein
MARLASTTYEEPSLPSCFPASGPALASDQVLGVATVTLDYPHGPVVKTWLKYDTYLHEVNCHRSAVREDARQNTFPFNLSISSSLFWPSGRRQAHLQVRN